MKSALLSAPECHKSRRGAHRERREAGSLILNYCFELVLLSHFSPLSICIFNYLVTYVAKQFA